MASVARNSTVYVPFLNTRVRSVIARVPAGACTVAAVMTRFDPRLRAAMCTVAGSESQKRSCAPVEARLALALASFGACVSLAPLAWPGDGVLV